MFHHISSSIYTAGIQGPLPKLINILIRKDMKLKLLTAIACIEAPPYGVGC